MFSTFLKLDKGCLNNIFNKDYLIHFGAPLCSITNFGALLPRSGVKQTYINAVKCHQFASWSISKCISFRANNNLQQIILSKPITR